MSVAPPSRLISAREGYELWAPQYALEANPLLALQQRRLEPMLPPIRGRRVVDLACGTGRWMERIVSRGPKIAVGLDFSFGMLERAAGIAELNGNLACGDCCSLPLRDRCADLLLCSLALDHVPDLESFAREAARIADDGAVLIISEFHPEAHARGWKRTFRTGEVTFELEVTPRSLALVNEAMRDAGFRFDDCEEPCFSDAERSLFLAAGREDLFERVRNAGPALYISRYIRASRAGISVAAAELSLANAKVAVGPHRSSCLNVEITNGEFLGMNTEASAATVEVDLSGYLLLPGLINAHDHLEFSLYPRLGHGPYDNAREWAIDIYHPERSPVREHRLVPKDVRLWWGALKNLLCGVTTVSHHNPYSPVFAEPDFPVRVVAQYGWAHSFAEEPDVADKFAATSPGSPFFIHLGEGTDHAAKSEFAKLEATGARAARTVVVHGVALSSHEHNRLQAGGGGVVWCPSSNLFMLADTLPADVIDSSSRIALGNDSPITASGDLLDEMAVARAYGVRPDRLYELVTSLAANVVNEGAGAIIPGVPADLVAVRDRGCSPAETLARASHADIELVIMGGRLRLISPDLLSRWPGGLPEGFECIVLEDVERFVAAPVAKLLQAGRLHLGNDIRLAGKRVSQ
jgi:cytosine/adenosine deaminase-related metal-dependent hydrolase/SAM-dependent methyltransferase